MNISTRFSTFILAVFFSLSGSVFAGTNTETDDNDVILAGYDAVAYFTQNKPVLGNKKYTATYNDSIYRFSSSKNRDLFRENPEQYAPVYGGFCAYGMTLGKKFEVNGKAFKVVEGRLYVNKNRKVYDIWQKDIPTHIQQADEKWPTVENTPAKEL